LKEKERIMARGKHFTPEQKMLIIREFPENQIPISKLADKYEIHPKLVPRTRDDIYDWKKKLFDSAEEFFIYDLKPRVY